jgi:hypothetical protein
LIFLFSLFGEISPTKNKAADAPPPHEIPLHRSLSLSRAAAPTRLPLPLLLFFCSSWWKRREENNDNGKDPALFSSTFATLLLLLLCFSNSLLSFSVVAVFQQLF